METETTINNGQGDGRVDYCKEGGFMAQIL